MGNPESPKGNPDSRDLPRKRHAVVVTGSEVVSILCRGHLVIMVIRVIMIIRVIGLLGLLGLLGLSQLQGLARVSSYNGC